MTDRRLPRRKAPPAPASPPGGRMSAEPCLAAGPTLDVVREPGEEYLSIKQLEQRIPYAEQTIRNLMSAGVLKRDVHYVKPRGRIIFKWSALQAWLEGQR